MTAARKRPRLAVLLLSAVLAALLPRLTEAGLDMRLRLGVPFAFNPSVIALPEGGYLTTARTAYMKGVAGRWWWINSAYICRDTDINFPQPACRRYDPFGGRFQECMWRGLVDTRGIEDPKLFVWPGRGVYAVFNRKPRAIARPDAVLAYGTPPAPEACPDDEPWLQQFIAAVRPSAGAGEWALREPVALRVTVPGFYDEQRAKRQIMKEKNWMPLVADDRLYMVHSIHPQHLVFQIARDGSTPRQLASSWPPRLGALLEGRDVHGGPPAVHVTGAMLEGAGLGRGGSSSGEGDDSGAGGGRRRGYHLGVLHYFTKNATWSKTRGKDTKYYFHYFYKMRDEPPFAPCALSAEIPLVFRRARPAANGEALRRQRIWKDTSHTAFVSGLHLQATQQQQQRANSSAPAGQGGLHGGRRGGAGAGAAAGSEPRLLVSYGSSDIDARLQILTLRQLEALFAGLPDTC